MPEVAIVVSHRIRAREFRGEIPAADIEVLLRCGRVALATPLAAPGLPTGTRLLKAYATSAQ
jgi:hypothetical protein